MVDRCCLVPGTGGTKLLANGVDIGYPLLLQGAALLLSHLPGGMAGVIDLLSMAHQPGQAAPVRTSLRTGTQIAPGPLLDLAYNQVPGDYLRFSYDWRADIRHSAAQLVDWLLHQRPTDGGRLRLVAHSQGGLVVVAASKLHADRVQPAGDNSRRFAELVRDVVLVGVPLHGTLNAAHALARGEALGRSAASDFVHATGTWPSLYQMLPAWNGCLRTPAGAATTGLLDAAAWTGHPTVDPELLARARQTRADILDTPLDRMAGVDVTIYLARNRGTWSSATLDGGRVTFLARDAEGDGLVPYAATRDWMTPVEVGRLQASGPDEPIAEHAMLCTDPWVASFFKGFLR